MAHSSLQRMAVGHVEATRECIQEYGPLIWSLARRLTRSAADAEDATQEIFLSLWLNAGRFDPSKGSDKVFIMTIARRRLVDRIRRQVREPPMEPVEAIDAAGIDTDSEASVSSAADHERMVAAFSALRRDRREVLELSLLEGLTQTEIAARLAMPLGTVKSAMRRGLMELREFGNTPIPPQHSAPPRVFCRDSDGAGAAILPRPRDAAISSPALS